ncbi:MAG: hypothetical protein PHF67_00435 [Candidatus Nanoarchaeia archaeon]|nr:hypothetical protein [Candidatus Nanoarchaeia archaeon]
MKLGVKTYDDGNFLKAFENSADFFEVQAVQKNNYDFLKKVSRPIVIHAEHFSLGANPADKTLFEKNLKSANFAIELANQTNAKKIILHPGNLINKDCSEEQAVHFFKFLNDKRIIIENLSGNKGLCLIPKETKEFLKSINKNLCFDVSHCIASSNILGIDYKKTLKEYLRLNPIHFHISGQDVNLKFDNHFSFFDKNSNISIKEILSLFPKDAEITLEVTTDIEKTKKDLEFIREIIKEL